jgi:DNA-binding CsgD family transcriptional regulator
MKGTFNLSDCVIDVCSRNPIAKWAISNLLAQSTASWRIATFFANPSPVASPGLHIVLFDVSSVPEWPSIIPGWTSAGYRVILLATEEWGSGGTELRALHLGVGGIVHITKEFPNRLAQAVNEVASGRLFVQDGFVREAPRSSRHTSSSPLDATLSFRERQVMDLLMVGFSNRRIGTVLGISARTAKFHVGNILHKRDVRSRRDLLAVADSLAQDSETNDSVSTTLPE